MKLSDKLIVLRKGKGWSQEDFAEKLDVSRQAISRWENGTALPDAQNILRISKLFNVTSDYLLNDDYEEELNNALAEAAVKETKPLIRKKKHLYGYLLLVTCFIILSAFAVGKNMKRTNDLTSADEVHHHPVLRRVIENKIDPTCTTEGSYDEVIYCAECDAEVLRTHISMGMPVHQFQNEKCIVCGEEQRARD